MRTILLILAAATVLPAGSISSPSYTKDGRLLPPQNYREWIYLSSGLDMSYTPERQSGTSVFDNVFVNPEAYRAFVETGAWPDKTVFVLEIRNAARAGSINRSGHFQSEDVGGIEVHLKDEARGGWAFYPFPKNAPAAMIPKTASCYSCHLQHGAVDTTFVQFYPTLAPIAKQKGTFQPNR